MYSRETGKQLVNHLLDEFDTATLLSCSEAVPAHTTEPLHLVLQSFTQMLLWVFGSHGQGMY